MARGTRSLINDSSLFFFAYLRKELWQISLSLKKGNVKFLFSKLKCKKEFSFYYHVRLKFICMKRDRSVLVINDVFFLSISSAT